MCIEAYQGVLIYMLRKLLPSVHEIMQVCSLLIYVTVPQEISTKGKGFHVSQAYKLQNYIDLNTDS